MRQAEWMLCTGEELLLREMREEDIGRVSRLEAEIFSLPWKEQDFGQALADAQAHYTVAVMEGILIGYCGIHHILEEGDITNVAVAAEARGRGIASKMLEQALCWGQEAGMESFTLEVRAGNAAAIAVYRKLGFKTEGVRRNFYEKPREDALIMWKRPETDGTFPSPK